MYKIVFSLRALSAIFALKVLTLIFALFTVFSPAHARTFQTNDNRFISYTDIGSSGGVPIVLIHAFPTDRRIWEAENRGIQDVFYSTADFRVITIDLWGFGQSSPSSSSSSNGTAITMEDYASEVNQLLNYLKIEKDPVIGGESMGGYVALAFLEKYPKKVGGLILSGTQSIADTPEIKAKREAAAIDIMEHGTKNFINDFISKALSTDAGEKTKALLKNILEKQDKMALASALRGMALRHDTSSLLANTSLPILILTGEEDRLISPQQSQNMHALAKNSKLVIIPKAGHLASFENPEKWSWAVRYMFYPL
jgi:pimeloyl-ACP methyl ester carboxylesterase